MCSIKKLVRGRWVIAGFGMRRKIIRNGAVYVEGNTIRDIGHYQKLSVERSYDIEIGSENHVVIPGLINAHNHGRGVTTVQKGRCDEPLEIRIHSPFELDVNTYYDTLLCAMRAIQSGVTCIMHHYYGVNPVHESAYRKDCEEAIKAWIDSGMRVAFAPSIQDQNSYVYENNKKFESKLPNALKDKETLTEEEATRTRIYFKVFKELFHKFNGYKDRIKVLLGPANPTWCSDELLFEVKKTSRKLGTKITMHLLETRYQEQFGHRVYGEGVIEHLFNLGFLGPDISCAHSVWLTKENIDIMKKTEAIPIHNPTSNLRLSSGISPVLRMIEQGVNVALGTDGLGFSDDDDMFAEMRMCWYLHRVPSIKARGLTSSDVLDMATITGAKVTGFDNIIGALEIGRRADIVLLDVRRIFDDPILSSKIPVLDALLHRTKSLDVDTVLIDGKTVLKKGHFVRLDKQKVFDEIREAKKRKIDNKNVNKLKALVKKWFLTWKPDTCCI